MSEVRALIDVNRTSKFKCGIAVCHAMGAALPFSLLLTFAVFVEGVSLGSCAETANATQQTTRTSVNTPSCWKELVAFPKVSTEPGRHSVKTTFLLQSESEGLCVAERPPVDESRRPR